MHHHHVNFMPILSHDPLITYTNDCGSDVLTRMNIPRARAVSSFMSNTATTAAHPRLRNATSGSRAILFKKVYKFRHWRWLYQKKTNIVRLGHTPLQEPTMTIITMRRQS